MLFLSRWSPVSPLFGEGLVMTGGGNFAVAPPDESGMVGDLVVLVDDPHSIGILEHFDSLGDEAFGHRIAIGV
jgi:hypothetical protein